MHPFYKPFNKGITKINLRRVEIKEKNKPKFFRPLNRLTVLHGVLTKDTLLFFINNRIKLLNCLFYDGQKKSLWLDTNPRSLTVAS